MTTADLLARFKSQNKAAQALKAKGIRRASRAALYLWEKNGGLVPLAQAKAIADAFGLPLRLKDYAA